MHRARFVVLLSFIVSLLALVGCAALTEEGRNQNPPPNKPADPELVNNLPFTGGAPVTPTPPPIGCVLDQAPGGFPTTTHGVDIGDTLEDFTSCLTDVDGQEHHLYGNLGKVVLISMGAGWCPPCKDEAPDIQQLYEDFEDQGFVVLMSMGEGWSQNSSPNSTFIQEWIDTYSLTFPILDDGGWTVAQYYKPADQGYIPLNVIVDRDGVVVYNNVGGLPVTTARARIETALAKAPLLDYGD